jgi:hypothetical protein
MSGSVGGGRSLRRPRNLIAILIQACGVDGGRGAPGQLAGERAVGLVVAAV